MAGNNIWEVHKDKFSKHVRWNLVITVRDDFLIVIYLVNVIIIYG